MQQDDDSPFDLSAHQAIHGTHCFQRITYKGKAEIRAK